jgi:hypothetical protein
MAEKRQELEEIDNPADSEPYSVKLSCLRFTFQGIGLNALVFHSEQTDS